MHYIILLRWKHPEKWSISTYTVVIEKYARMFFIVDYVRSTYCSFRRIYKNFLNAKLELPLNKHTDFGGKTQIPHYY